MLSSIFDKKKNLDKKKEKNRIRALSPTNFEKYMAELFRGYGYEVIVTPPTNDGGKDLIIKYDNRKYYVECKHFSDGAVGREVVQKLVGAGVVDGDVYGYIVSTSSYFNDNAINCMEKTSVPLFLLDLDDIVSLRIDKNIDAANELFLSDYDNFLNKCFLSDSKKEVSIEEVFLKYFGNMGKYKQRIAGAYWVNPETIKVSTANRETTYECSYKFIHNQNLEEFRRVAFTRFDGYYILCSATFDCSKSEIVSLDIYDKYKFLSLKNDFKMRQLRCYVSAKV